MQSPWEFRAVATGFSNRPFSTTFAPPLTENVSFEFEGMEKGRFYDESGCFTPTERPSWAPQ